MLLINKHFKYTAEDKSKYKPETGLGLFGTETDNVTAHNDILYNPMSASNFVALV